MNTDEAQKWAVQSAMTAAMAALAPRQRTAGEGSAATFTTMIIVVTTALLKDTAIPPSEE